ncbi:metallophosphoesterase [Foetidibacter luteolus]|uniref:metallophosphoesterase n=1 Tax=Foetidibacter luteolus TaxID=2608880 RepID=UPI00129A8FA9|nr:metallophosphoesterase [Foetidibacter luteolus]
MRTFVMGDIHGTHKALLQCLELVNFDYSNDTLIQLGDVADGYDEVFECVEELLKIPNLIALKGNHDEWMSHFLETGFHPQAWAQGGKATAMSYLRQAGKKEVILSSRQGYTTTLNPADIPETHHSFFRKQHLYYIDDNNNCFVHGGFDRRQAFKGQTPFLYYWDRDLWNEALSWKASARGDLSAGQFHMATGFNHIFIGHTNTLYWNTDKPMHAANIFNIDTGAGHSGRLTIMNVETLQYWQSEPVSTWYDKRHR